MSLMGFSVISSWVCCACCRLCQFVSEWSFCLIVWFILSTTPCGISYRGIYSGRHRNDWTNSEGFGYRHLFSLFEIGGCYPLEDSRLTDLVFRVVCCCSLLVQGTRFPVCRVLPHLPLDSRCSHLESQNLSHKIFASCGVFLDKIPFASSPVAEVVVRV